MNHDGRGVFGLPSAIPYHRPTGILASIITLQLPGREPSPSSCEEEVAACVFVSFS